MVLGLIRAAALAVPVAARAVSRILPRAAPTIVRTTRRFIGVAGSGITRAVGGVKTAVQSRFKARKSPASSGVINAAAAGAFAGGPVLGAIFGGAAAGRGRRLAGAGIGFLAGRTVKAAGGIIKGRGDGGIITPAAGAVAPLDAAGGIIKNENTTSIPGTTPAAPRQRARAAPRRRTTRRRRAAPRRRRRMRRRGRRRGRTFRGRRTHAHVRGRTRGRSRRVVVHSHRKRHKRVTFTTKDGRRVSFQAHRR